MATYKAIFFCLVQLVIFLTMCRAEQDMEGEILLHVQHSFDLGKTWQDRGIVNIHNTRTGASSHDQVSLLPEQKAALQAQCEVQGLYMVKLTEQKSGSEVGLHRSYTSACSLLEAGLMDLLTLNMDWRGKLMSVALGVQQQPSNTNRNSQVRIRWQDRLINFISVARDQAGPFSQPRQSQFQDQGSHAADGEWTSA